MHQMILWGAFHHALLPWRMTSWSSRKPFLVETPFKQGEMHDSGISTYVDDIFDIQIVDRSTAEQLGREIRAINDQLDRCLAEGGYEQIRKKPEVTPCLRNLAENRKCYRLNGVRKDLVQHEASGRNICSHRMQHRRAHSKTEGHKQWMDADVWAVDFQGKDENKDYVLHRQGTECWTFWHGKLLPEGHTLQGPGCGNDKAPQSNVEGAGGQEI